MKKVVLAALLTLLLAVGLILAAGAEEYTEGYYTYTVEDGEATITKVHTAISGDVNIPATLGGFPVTHIGDYAFSRCYNLTGVTISSTVRSIGSTVFLSCSSLTSVVIPDNVNSISSGAFLFCDKLVFNTHDNAKYLGNNENPYHALIEATSLSIASCSIHPDTVVIAGEAFGDCDNLTSIQFPGKVITIGNRAFLSCDSLTNVSISDSTTHIETMAFYSCTNLTSILFPKSVISIGARILNGCNNLKSIAVAQENSMYHSSGNCLIETASKTLISGISGSLIPSDGSVTTIGAGAFSNCENLTDIHIPDSVTCIEAHAFYCCSNLTSVTFGEDSQLTTIADHAFYDCENLKPVIIPASVKSIGDWAFAYCDNLSNITFLSDDTSIVSFYSIPSGTVIRASCDSQARTYAVKWYHVSFESISHAFGRWNTYTATQHSRTCVCGKKEYAEHNWSGVITTQPTHLAEGIETFSCTTCTVKKTEPVGKLPDHEFGKWEKHDDAQHLHKCPCGEEEYEEHNWDDGMVTIEPTYVDKGLKTHTCTDCTATKLEPIDKLVPLYGDANGDGVVNGQDLLLLRKYLANFDYATNTSTIEVSIGADINGGGEINGQDLLLLRKYLANFDYETGTSTIVLGPTA